MFVGPIYCGRSNFFSNLYELQECWREVSETWSEISETLAKMIDRFDAQLWKTSTEVMTDYRHGLIMPAFAKDMKYRDWKNFKSINEENKEKGIAKITWDEYVAKREKEIKEGYEHSKTFWERVSHWFSEKPYTDQDYYNDIENDPEAKMRWLGGNNNA